MFLCYKEIQLVQFFATPASIFTALVRIVPAEAQGRAAIVLWLWHWEFLRAGWALPDHVVVPPPAGLAMFFSTHQCLCHTSLLLWIIALINPPGHCSWGLLTAEITALELQHHPKTQRLLQTPAAWHSFSSSLLSAPSGSFIFRAMNLKF